MASLARRSVRARRGVFLAEGPQVVREAVVCRPDLVRDLYVDELAAATPGPVADIAHQARDRGLMPTLVTPGVMAAMGDTHTPQGILAVCAIPDVGVHDVLGVGEGGPQLDQGIRPDGGRGSGGGPRLLAILAAVRDPGNAGTVIRGADAAGADGVLLSTDSVDPYNPKCVRSTAGSLFHLPIVSGLPIEEVVDQLRGQGLRVLAADGTAERSIEEVDLVTPHAWVLGNEAWGLPQALRDRCDESVRVPIYGRAESLNLAMAATVCLYASAAAQRRTSARAAMGGSS